jgi:5-methylthioribose kinase
VSEERDARGFDIERDGVLAAYLHRSGRIDPAVRVEATPLSGGVSNRTMLVRLSNGEAWVVKQALDRLRVAVPWFCDPGRILIEGRAMSWLADLAPPGTIPEMLFLDDEAYLLAMRAVPEPHRVWKSLLLEGEVVTSHVEAFATLLASVHRRSAERIGALMQVFGDRSYYETLRLEPYYRYVARQVPESAPFYAALIDETLALRIALVHGDYSPKNILVHANTLVLIDHEVAHVGDPAFDVAFALTHLLSKAHARPSHRGALVTAATRFWQRYEEGLADVPWRGPALEARSVRHTLGCLLARVAGRSPLEYLDADARRRQRKAVVHLIADPPATIMALIECLLHAVHAEEARSEPT